MSDLKELRRLAELATPGPWEFDLALDLPKHTKGTRAIYARPEPNHIVEIVESPSGVKECIWNENDAAFIAASNPDTVLKLIEIAEAAKNIDELWFDASKEIGIACHTCDTGGGETFVRPDGHDLKCRIAKVHDALCAAYPKDTK